MKEKNAEMKESMVKANDKAKAALAKLKVPEMPTALNAVKPTPQSAAPISPQNALSTSH